MMVKKRSSFAACGRYVLHNFMCPDDKPMTKTNAAFFIALMLTVMAGLVFSESVFAAGIKATEAKAADQSVPARGNFDFAFDIFDSGKPQAALVASDSKFAIPLRKGRFAITVDVPKALLDVDELWLQIQAGPGGTGAYENVSGQSLALKTTGQKIQSTKFLVSGTVMETADGLALLKPQVRWIGNRKKEDVEDVQIVQLPSREMHLPEEDGRPGVAGKKTFLTKLREDTGLEIDDIRARISSVRFADLELTAFATHQIMELVDPETMDLRSGARLMLVFLVRADHEEQESLAEISHKDEVFDLKVEYRDRRAGNVFLTVQLDNVALQHLGLLEKGRLASLSLRPGSIRIDYQPKKSEKIADVAAFPGISVLAGL